MSITVTQEEAKWQPVTIIIDDERTANMLRYLLDNFCNYPPPSSSIVGNVYKIDNTEDLDASVNDMRIAYRYLENLITD